MTEQTSFESLRTKWSNPGKGVAPSATPRCCSNWKGNLRVALDYGRQIYLLTDKLDEIYLRDEHTMAYMAFKDFHSNKMTAGVKINNFSVWDEFLLKKLRKFGITLSVGVQTFFSFLFWMQWMNQNKAKSQWEQRAQL